MVDESLQVREGIIEDSLHLAGLGCHGYSFTLRMMLLGGRYYVVDLRSIEELVLAGNFRSLVVRTFLLFDFGRTRSAGFGDFLHTKYNDVFFGVPENVAWLEIVPVNDYNMYTRRRLA